MGATPWEELAPWSSDPEVALRALQARVVAERYDLPGLVRRELDGTREQIAAWEADGDPFDLVAGYRKKLEWLSTLAASPIPTEPAQQIELVRRAYADSGQGIGNVLDVEGISVEAEPLRATRLTEEKVMAIFGTSRPSPGMAQKTMSHMAGEIGRGESVCFPVYGPDGSPVGWWFAGYSID